MLPILTKDDFTGLYALGLNANLLPKLALYITEFEQKYICELLSEKAYIDISTQSTLQAKYTDLINGCNWIDEYEKERVNFGFKEFLKAIVWANWNKDNFENSNTNNKQSSPENSTIVDENKNRNLWASRYNKAVKLWNENIALFILEFQQIEKDITSIESLGGNIYQINLASTKYLYNADKVVISGVSYVVSNLVEDTSFTITSENTINATTFYHEPFYEFNLYKLTPMFL